MNLPRLQPWSRLSEALGQLLQGATLRTCAPVAVVVGMLLSMVNQGDVLLAGDADARVAMKVAANLMIPFMTSSAGALLAVRTGPLAGAR